MSYNKMGNLKHYLNCWITRSARMTEFNDNGSKILAHVIQNYTIQDIIVSKAENLIN
jgi:hypothetical protein